MSQRTFKDFLEQQHNLKPSTIRGYKGTVQQFEEIAKQPFEICYLDEETVHHVLAELDKKFEPSTWNIRLERYQRLAKWLYDDEDEECPKVWRKIEFKKIDWDKKLAKKAFTEEEFYKLLNVIDNPRDKAFIGVGGEGGLRPGELLGLNVGDCEPAPYGFIITVSGKTGTRPVPIVLFAPLLKTWLNHHPQRKNKEAPLWVQRGRINKNVFTRVTYWPMNAYHLKRYCKLAGIYRPKIAKCKGKDGKIITKEVNGASLHYLRHTKVTWTAKNRKVHIGIKQANKMFGWSPNSTRYLHYSHIAGQDSEDAFLELAGVKEVDEPAKPSMLLRKKCLGCGEQNSADALYCFKCGTVLDEEQAKRIVAREQMLDKILKAAEKLDEDKT